MKLGGVAPSTLAPDDATGVETVTPPTVVIVAPPDSPIVARFARLLTLLGGQARAVPPDRLRGAAWRSDVVGVVLLPDLLNDRDPDDLADMLRTIDAIPVFVSGVGQGDSCPLLRAVSEVCAPLTRTASTHHRAYQFTRDWSSLWPFGGVELAEAAPRPAAGLRGENEQWEPLIWSASAPLVVRCRRPGRELIWSSVEVLPRNDGLLKQQFCPASFMETLPFLAFARSVIGDRGWTSPGLFANVMVDDPNLLLPHFGFVDYREAARIAATRSFHLTLAFIPIDFWKTSPEVARLFHEHPHLLSLVMHGNDHRKRELAQRVSPEEADWTVRQALQRMQLHQSITGLPCPTVMTFPHGAGSRLWIRALRDAGYTAAIASHSYPFTEDPGGAGAPPDYEMLPAELSLYGFPIVNRFKLEEPKEALLFAAWLGKPLILYTHHTFMRDGWDRLIDIVDFVNRQASPTWSDIDTITRANYRARRHESTLEIQAFSNDLRIDLPADIRSVVVTKDGRDIPSDDELLLVHGDEAPFLDRTSTRLRAALAPEPGSAVATMHLRFHPSTADRRVDGWRRTRLSSHLRRTLTEARDRLAPVWWRCRR
jgi:hypothetical protein